MARFKILAIFLSAAAYPFILTSGYFPYQGRQMAPFIALGCSQRFYISYF